MKQLVISVGLLVNIYSLNVDADNQALQSNDTPLQQVELIDIEIQDALETSIADRIKHKSQSIDRQAYFAIHRIKEAQLELQSGRIKAAQSLIKQVAGLLKDTISANPEAEFVAIEVIPVRSDDLNDLQLIQLKQQEIDLQWSSGHKQLVRQLLSSYVNNFVITTKTISLSQFENGVKQLSTLLRNKAVAKAQSKIAELSDLIKTQNTLIPLPICRAELMIEKARQLAIRQTTQLENTQDLVVYMLQQVESQLKMAELLGYGEQKRYIEFYKAIEGVKSLAVAGQNTTKLLIRLNTLITSLKAEVIDELSQTLYN
ncbi:MAG: YfdX family protein [Gammaproteobacteria bacterium]|nr:YfdX family protein [Gammaproteobacteria bacterium]